MPKCWKTQWFPPSPCFPLRKKTWIPTGNILIKRKNSCKCWIFDICLGVKKWVTFKWSKNWKASLLDFWVHCCSYILTSDGVGWSWRRCSMTSTWPFWKRDSLVPISRTFIFFSIRSGRLLGHLKWNHTHGRLYWWFTFTANSLSSGALRSLIPLQQATNCEVMYWSQQSVSLCWQPCFNVMMPKAQEAFSWQ